MKKRRASKRTQSKEAREFERRAAKAMSDVLGCEVKRRVIGEEAQGGDLGRDLNGCAPFSVQVKHGVSFSIHGAMREAAKACDKKHKVPVAITKRVGGNRVESQPMVTMLLVDFVAMVKKRVRAAKRDGVELPQGTHPELVGDVRKDEFTVEGRLISDEEYAEMLGDARDAMPELYEE